MLSDVAKRHTMSVQISILINNCFFYNFLFCRSVIFSKPFHYNFYNFYGKNEGVRVVAMFFCKRINYMKLS